MSKKGNNECGERVTCRKLKKDKYIVCLIRGGEVCKSLLTPNLFCAEQNHGWTSLLLRDTRIEWNVVLWFVF